MRNRLIPQKITQQGQRNKSREAEIQCGWGWSFALLRLHSAEVPAGLRGETAGPGSTLVDIPEAVV